MSDRSTLEAAQEATGGRVSASEPGIEAQDIQAPAGAAQGRTADPDQLTALRSWLAAEALKIQHRLPRMRVPEGWWSMDGMAHGVDYSVRIIDRFVETGQLPVAGGAECDCADPKADHRKFAAARPPEYPLEPSDSCPGFETVPNRCYCDCEGCKSSCAAHQTLRQRTDRAEAALGERETELPQLRARLDAVRRYAELTAGSCRVPAAETARDVLRILDAAPTPEAGR